MDHSDNFVLLFRKYIDRELSQSELEALKKWIDESADNKKLFVSFLSLHKVDLQLISKDLIDGKEAWNKIHRRINVQRRKQLIVRWTVAASVIATIGFFSLLYWTLPDFSLKQETSLVQLYPNMGEKKAFLTLSNGKVIPLQGETKMVISETNGKVVGYNESNHLVYENNRQISYVVPLYNKITVPRGGEYTITLSDGTRVWLNADSKLEYPVSFSSIRNVKLEGEAYFEVAHDKHSPFVVYSRNIKVQVLGTKFNVNSYDPEHVFVTLAEGKVSVSSPYESNILLPGDQAEISTTQALSDVKKVNVNIYTSWVTGTFEFNDTPMEDIVTQLSLWYNVNITFASPELKQTTFTGAILKSKSLGYALELIQRVSNINFEKKGDVIVVTQQEQ